MAGPVAAFADFGNSPAKLLEHDDPRFPFKMNFADDHRAVFLVDVDADGRAEGVRVISATRPDMEEPLVEALLNWGYAPAMRNGRSVRSALEVPVDLRVYHSGLGYTEEHFAERSWGIPPRALPGVPDNFQYDRAPVPYLTLPAVYPREMLLRGIRGWATIAFTIDPSGQPRQFLVAEASRPEFGPPAAAMMATWKFSSPAQGGTACWAALKMKQVFGPSDEDVQTDDETDRVVRELNATPCPIVRSIRELDAIPRARYRPAPVVPDSTQKAALSAKAVIEIVIDRKGHAQAARIVSATQDDFGWAAATAAGRWQFAVPTKAGKPVDVLVNIPFRYEPPLPPAVPDGIRLEGADGHWRPYQSYLHEMVKSVSIEWTRAVREGGGAISASGNSIEVNFIVDKNGKVARILSFHPSRGTSKAAIDVCLAGIRNGAPYGDWTEEMVAALGPSQELTFAFDYQ